MKSHKRRSIGIAVAVMALVGACSIAQDIEGKQPKVSILLPSPGRASQADLQVISEPTGESEWLGLYRQGGVYAWKKTQVRIGRAAVDREDPPSGPWTGLHVTAVGQKTPPLLMVQGIPALAQVKVVPAEYPTLAKQKLASDRPIEIRYQSEIYRLRRSPPYGNPQRVSLVLEHEAQRQMIDSRNRVQCDSEDTTWKVLWAGDLDGDGKLDLFVSGGSCTGYTDTLLLSSRAARDEFVHAVASREFGSVE